MNGGARRPRSGAGRANARARGRGEGAARGTAPRSKARPPAPSAAVERQAPRRAVRAGPDGAFERGAWPDVSRALARQDWGAIGPLLAGVPDPAALEGALRRFCELVLQWNRKVSNLISRNDEPRLVSRHVVESLAPLAALREHAGGAWIDFGSGGGFPAIPLALAGVGERWTLVESRRTKCLFLRRAAQELGLANVEVRQSRLEDLVEDPDLAGRHSGFTSRATTALQPTLRLASRLVHSGGSAWLWKGSALESELGGSPETPDGWRLASVTALGGSLAVVARFVRDK